MGLGRQECREFLQGGALEMKGNLIVNARINGKCNHDIMFSAVRFHVNAYKVRMESVILVKGSVFTFLLRMTISVLLLPDLLFWIELCLMNIVVVKLIWSLFI